MKDLETVFGQGRVGCRDAAVGATVPVASYASVAPLEPVERCAVMHPTGGPWRQATLRMDSGVGASWTQKVCVSSGLTHEWTEVTPCSALVAATSATVFLPSSFGGIDSPCTSMTLRMQARTRRRNGSLAHTARGDRPELPGRAGWPGWAAVALTDKGGIGPGAERFCRDSSPADPLAKSPGSRRQSEQSR